MGLYKRGKVWWFSLTIGGKQRFFSTKTSDKGLAKEIYLRALSEIKRPNPISSPAVPEVEVKPITVGEFLQTQYLPFCQHQPTYRSKQTYFRLLSDWFKALQINKVTTRDVELLQGDLLKGGIVKKGRMPATVNRVTAFIKHAFRKACEWELIPEDVLRKVQRVKLLKGEVKRLRFLSTEECQALIESADPHIRPIIVLALNTGMRRGEILNLKWSQVDLKHGYCNLPIERIKKTAKPPFH